MINFTPTRLRFLGKLKGGAGFPHSKQGDKSAPIPFYKVKDLASANQDGYLTATDNYIEPETAALLGAFIFPKNTIFMAKVGAALLLHRFARASGPSCIDNNMLGLVPYTSVDSDFLLYSMETIRFEDIVNPGAVPSLSAEAIGNRVVLVPPLPIQRSIANFLDRKTAAIDALISEKEKLIERLEELRASIVHRAVTRGLDPTVELKDSGVAWIGEVPRHWTMLRIANFSTKITNGYVGPTRGLFVDSGVPYLQSLHIKQNKVKFTPTYHVPEEWSASKSKSILKEDDVLVVQTGDIGQVAVVPKEHEGSNCHALIIISTRKDIISGKFLAWALNSNYGNFSLMRIRTGALHPHLNCTLVREVRIAVPPTQEQHQISEYIDQEVARLNDIKESIDCQTTRLKEYRQSLITHAVTGQMTIEELDAQPTPTDEAPPTPTTEGEPAQLSLLGE